MKAISLWQPWASAIACGTKKHETRSWAAPSSLIGQRVAIHAAKRWTREEKDVVEYYREFEGSVNLGFEGVTPPLGAIVAVATLAEVIPITKEWAHSLYLNDFNDYELGNYEPGRFAWNLKNIVSLDPIPCKGAQGFFDIPALEQSLVDIQLAGKVIAMLKGAFS